jgi:ComEC/Rec2-related protein
VVAFAFLGLRAARLSRLPAAVGAVVALVCFVLLVRPEPSVLRAAVMGGIGVAAVLSGRGRVSLTLLMLSIIILLAADPWLAVSFAFTLSVAATLGLVTAGPAMVEALERVVPRLLAQLLAIPLTAQLFCTPILVLIQPSLPVYSLPANILASPVVPAITLLGMAAVLTLLGAPVLAPPLVAAAQVGTRWVAGVAEVLADAPSASLPWMPGVPGAVIASLVSAGLVLLIRRDAVVARWRHRGGRTDLTRTGPEEPTASRPGRERGRTRSRLGRRGRRGRRAMLLAAALGCLLGLAAASVLAGRAGAPQARSWVLAMCDVGQGDAVVVRTTPGHALVVDAGPDPEAMDRCLDALRVEVIDALVITHLHEDHYGGIEGAVRGRTLTALYFSTGEDRLPAEVEDAATAGGVRAERLDSASTLDLAPLHVDVLWPREDAVLPEENNASAVLAVTAHAPRGPLTILLMGDLEEEAAAALLSGLPSLRTDGAEIVKVAHHGARNGGTALLEAVHPRLALISVGEGNDYGHPHPSILGALDRTRTATARTDQLGTFLVEVVGSTLEVRPLQ